MKESKLAKFNRVMNLICCILCTTMLVGCGSKLNIMMEETIPEAINSRVTTNEGIAGQFKEMGLLSEKTFNKMCEDMNNQAKSFERDAKAQSGKALGNLMACVSAYYVYPGNGEPAELEALDDEGKDIILIWNGSEYKHEDSGTTVAGDAIADGKDPTEDWSESIAAFVMGNYLAQWAFSEERDNGYGHVTTDGWSTRKGYDNLGDRQKNGVIKPLQLVSPDVGEEINNNMKAQVYVLRPDVVTVDTANSIDGLHELIKQAASEGQLNSYFTAAKDEDGNPVYLVDPEDDSYNIINISKANDNGVNQCGYDLIIDQKVGEIEGIKIRLTEFDAEAVYKLNEIIGLNKYYFTSTNQDEGGRLNTDGIWKAYLMEYPVSVVKTIEDIDNTTSKVTFTQEFLAKPELSMGINLYTGQIVKYDENGVGTNCTTDEGELYYGIKGEINDEGLGTASFIINGTTTVNIKNSSDKAVKAYTGRIILRDYLETTIAPGFKDGEDLVCFGRKMRLNFKSGETNWITEGKSKVPNTTLDTSSLYIDTDYKVAKEEDFIVFVDIDGNEVPDSPHLQITDLCDRVPILQGKAEIQSQPPVGQKEGLVKDASITELEPGISSRDMKWVYTKCISPTVMFPCNVNTNTVNELKIAADDFNTDNEQKQRMYGLLTTKGLFESKLYSDWINSTSSTASLTWWNQYLADSGFLYTLDSNTVNSYVTNNFAYEASQNGIVILDLETVQHIQDNITSEHRDDTMANIRTFFMILGWGLIIFAAVLMLCWGLDTNADIGIKLLTKVTFGHWIAVKYADDIPYNNPNEHNYLTFGRMLLKCIILIVVGFILIYVDIFQAVLTLIELFGGVASKIEEVIQGIR